MKLAPGGVANRSRFWKLVALAAFTALLWTTAVHRDNARRLSDAIDVVSSRLRRPSHAEVAPQVVQADDVCKQHGWNVYQELPPRRRKVYDLFMINTELDWLEVRAGTLYDEVDWFIVVEANRTFTGLEKPLHLKKNWNKFKKFHSKMIYHQIEFGEDYQPKNAWDTESYVRDSMFSQAMERLPESRKPQLGDVIIVSDVDEIPRPQTMRTLRLCEFPRRLTLRSRFHYYSFQFLHQGTEWEHPQATFYDGAKTIKPQSLRGELGGVPDMWNASWHCSWCFATAEQFANKLNSFSHTEFNNEKFRSKDWIADHVRAGKDLLDRPHEIFDRIDNDDVPSYLVHHQDKYRYMLNRDGKTAGLTDYP